MDSFPSPGALTRCPESLSLATTGLNKAYGKERRSGGLIAPGAKWHQGVAQRDSWLAWLMNGENGHETHPLLELIALCCAPTGKEFCCRYLIMPFFQSILCMSVCFAVQQGAVSLWEGARHSQWPSTELIYWNSCVGPLRKQQKF